MTTTRTPIKPAAKLRITPEAIAAFREMIRLDAACTCVPYVYPDYPGRCASCDAWWHEHLKLFAALDLPPWEWPCVLRPDRPWHASRYPTWALAEKWQPGRAKVERYRALERAT